MGILKKKEATSEKKEVATTTKTAAAPKTTGVENVILHPVVTEKSAILASQGQYVFAIDTAANRVQVRNAIRTMFGITPVSVNIQRIRGKKVRFGRRKGVRKSWKKAIVTLPAGKTIDVYEGV